MEIDAQLQAEMQKQEAELAAQQARLEAQISKSAAHLEQVQQQAEEQLQGIQNKKQRIAAQTSSSQGQAEAAARQKRSLLRSVVAWRSALLKLAEDGAAALPTIRQALLDDATDADKLDVVFEAPDLGRLLLSHAAALPADQVPFPKLPKAAERGLALLAKGELVDALQVFESQVTAASSVSRSNSSSTADLQVLQGLTQLCQIKLNLPVKRVSSAQPPAAKKPRTAGGRSPEGSASGPGDSSRAAPSHPLRHLLDAMLQGSSSSGSRARRGLGVTNYREQRAADARAAGNALAFLMHPAVYAAAVQPAASQSAPAAVAVPRCLVEEALAVVAARGKSAFSSTSASPLLTEASSGGKAGGKQALQERAGNSKVLQEVLELTGLEPVKEAMLNLADQVALDKERGRDVNSSNYNVRFYGNPGTGKTTLARLYARLLTELGVLAKGTVEETTGADLVSGGTTKLKEQLKKLEEGGVLFIDEAYQLDPKMNPIGQQVLNYLLPEMENKRGKLVVVLAGYRKPMEENIMQFNEGLPSRFPLVFTFPDFTDEQLLSIFMGMLNSSKFTLQEDKHARIAARRLGRQHDSGAAGFGNARDVRNLLELAISRQSARVVQEKRQVNYG